MKRKPTFIDAKGMQAEADFDVTIYKEAAAEGLSVPQLLNRKYDTNAEMPAFDQLCQSSGLVLSYDKEFGYKPPTIGAVLDGKAGFNASTVLEGSPASRILYPAAILELIESALKTDRDTDPMAFDGMVGRDDYVTSTRIEQPVINLTKAEAGKQRAISQLAKPDHMMTITTSDVTKTIPTLSLGLLVSDEALNAISIDFVTMAVQRQAEVHRNSKVYEWLLEFLSGDSDTGKSALDQTKADTYDSTIVAAGAITKKALILWLLHNYYKRKISHIVGTVANYLTISDLFATTNTNQQVPTELMPLIVPMNRMLQNLQYFFVDPDAGSDWTANTLMGLDKRYAIHRITNTAAAYSAIEDFVLRRGKELRFDQGVICNRMFDDAFDVLSLTLT